MKKLLLLITFFPFIHGHCPNLSFRVNSTTITKDSKDLLIEAISYKESRHTVKAINVHEQAYGFLQIREGVVKDENDATYLGELSDIVRGVVDSIMKESMKS